jgi:hypothetical protein
VSADLRLGKWQDVLADVASVDALIVDAPYSERTHSGHDSAASDIGCLPGEPHDNRKRQALGLDAVRRKINYSPWSDVDVAEFVASWSPRVRGWFVTITDHVLSRAWESSLLAAGRYVFPPLPMVERGSRVRLSGDGPSNWTCWVVVARPSNSEFVKWGTLRGEYSASCERGRPVMGGKHVDIMRALVRDYTRPGDLVCDPCSGSGTTLLAALMEGRRAVGSEMDPAHYEIARKRLAKGWTPPLFQTEHAAPAEQLALGGGDE